MLGGLLQQTNDLSKCIYTNGYNVDFLEFSCIYPALSPFYVDFEKGYDPIWMVEWMNVRSPWFPLTACAIYGMCIVLGQAYFRTRPRWHWRTSMAIWNLFLSTFSLMGMIRMTPHLLHNLSSMSWRDNLCTDPQKTYGSGSTGVWVQLFVISKFPELLDTFFIIIHKKKLIFLHWYHHITVLLYCWHSYVTRSPPGIFFVAMNYTVHACMYFYYFLVACRIKPKWLNPMFITALQISQMIVGVFVTLSSFYQFKLVDESIAGPCYIPSQNITAGFIMYGSYLFLFLQFFVRRYWVAHFQQQHHQEPISTTTSTAAATNGHKTTNTTSSTSTNGKDKEL